MKKYLCLIFVIGWLAYSFPIPSWGAEVKFPTFGSGKKELIVFTDYFCPPCMKIELELGPAIKKALSTRDWKVTFVDIPGHKETFLFARHFIFAVQKGKTYENALLAREVLFNLSRQGGNFSAKDIEAAFKKEGVQFAPVDPWVVLNEWNRLIEVHKINGTPTCVLIEGDGTKTVFDGSVEIRNRLLPLLVGGPAGEKKRK